MSNKYVYVIVGALVVICFVVYLSNNSKEAKYDQCVTRAESSLRVSATYVCQSIDSLSQSTKSFNCSATKEFAVPKVLSFLNESISLGGIYKSGAQGAIDQYNTDIDRCLSLYK